MTTVDRTSQARTPGQIVRGALAVAAGILLLLLGLTMVSMCGPNRHIIGALVGSLGGILLGLVRKSRRLQGLALAGGILGAGLTTAFMDMLHGGCGELIFALLSGALVGAGSGLLADARSPSAVAGPPSSPADPTGSL